MSNMDKDQLSAVNCNKNVVVSAGAGSGKTTVLTHRYLRLVKKGLAGVENILTLTFTRKAAAEMYERIYSLLIENDGSTIVKEQLALFDKSQISTLDSFCSRIVKGWSQRFGIPSDFTQDDEETNKLSEETSLNFILENQDNPALKRFIFLNGFESVWKDYFKSIASGYLDISAPVDFDLLYKMQMDFLLKTLNEKIELVNNVFERMRQLTPGTMKTIKDAQKSISMIPSFSKDDKPEDITAGLINVKFRLPSSKSNEALIFRELVELWRSEKKAVLQIAGSLKSRAVIKELFILTGKFQKEFLKRKIESGVLSFQDIASMAVKILEENKELRMYYKKKYQYIMVDEFQDNNLLQKKLLYLLAEKESVCSNGIPEVTDLDDGKLFFVGDEKQSIYKFRGADVSVFKKLSGELKAIGGKSINLSRNYRSEPELIRFYNSLFPEVMKEADEEYEAEFSPLESRSKKMTEASIIKMLYKPYNAEPPEAAVHSNDAEAWNIAVFIKTAVETKKLMVPGDNGDRPAEYKDFAILMRSTGNQIRYEKMLRRAGIPYSASNVRTLFLEAPLNDIYNLLQLSVYPLDRIAYTAFLRSPMVNLSDPALIKIVGLGENPFDKLPEEMKISQEEQVKYEKGGELYSFISLHADKIPIAQLVFHIWYTYGYRYHVMKNPTNHGYLEYYDYLEKMAMEADSRQSTLSGFLDFLRPNLGKYEKIQDIDILSEKKEGVLFLSIHKSKGLEFPIIILAGTGGIGRAETAGSAPYYISDKFGLSLNILTKNAAGVKSGQNYFYTIGKEENKKKELAELKRLLYVALTRGESHLIISGCHNKNNRSSENVHLNMLFNAFGITGENCVTKTGIPLSITEIQDISEDEIFQSTVHSKRNNPEAIAAAYNKTEEINRLTTITDYSVTEINNLYADKIKEANMKLLSALKSDPIINDEKLEAVFGTLCHFIIEKKLEGDYSPDHLPSSITENISVKNLPLLLADAEVLCDSFLSSPLGKRTLLSNNYETELPFLYRLETAEGDKYIRGQIDLFFEEDDKAVIIDFKTNKHIVPAEYSAQLSIYREAVEQLTDKPVSCFLFYLRDAVMVEVTERVDVSENLLFSVPS